MKTPSTLRRAHSRGRWFTHVLAWLTPVLGLAASAGVQAQSAARPLQDVQISATREPVSATRVTEDIESQPASVTVIDRQELDRRTITTYGDIFRGVGGFSVIEYGQGLVAYGMTLRGFDSDHGRNIAIHLDGMPLNVTGSQHTNGYVDLAQLIPELINRVEIVRGPFSVLAGNHAVGGSVQLFTDASPPSSARITVDQFGRTRILPVYRTAAGPGNLLVALDATKGSGYNRQSDLERLNLFTRYTLPVAQGLAALRIQAYEAKAEAPGYLNYDAYLSRTVGPRDFLSRGIGDAKSQQNVVFNFRSNDLEGTTGLDGGWFVSVYANHDIRKRWTNYDLSTPLGSAAPLNQERDRLRQLGFDVRKTTTFTTFGLLSQLLAGVQFNDERLHGRRFATDADQNPAPPTVAAPDTLSIDRRITTRTRSLYVQYQLQPVEALKLTGGLRYDRLAFDTRLESEDDTYAAAQTAGGATAVSQSTGQWSPKLGAALVVQQNAWHRTELIGNVARGLKSPYAFSDFYGNLGLAAGVPDLSISSVTSRELGLQGSSSDAALRWRATGWSTRQESEVDRTAAGLLQSFRKTDRKGFDLEGTIAFSPSTRLFANYSRLASARVLDPVTPGADRIPNVPEYAATIGVASLFRVSPHRFDVSLSSTLIGPHSVTTTDTLRSKAYHRTTARIAYSHADWKGTTVFLNLVGYSRQFDSYVVDFGGGTAGAIVLPRFLATAGIQIPL